jgi:hypothetical protein
MILVIQSVACPKIGRSFAQAAAALRTLSTSQLDRNLLPIECLKNHSAEQFLLTRLTIQNLDAQITKTFVRSKQQRH